jgi:hypothetical protein
VEQYGPGEAYMPLLEATARLCRGRLSGLRPLTGTRPGDESRAYVARDGRGSGIVHHAPRVSACAGRFALE